MGLADIREFLSKGAGFISGAGAVDQSPQQAETEKVIKQLGFPEEMIDRFGDTLGTRKRRLSDFARDAALGFINDDPSAGMKLRQQVADRVGEALNRQRERADQDEAKRREDNEEILNFRELALSSAKPSQTFTTLFQERFGQPPSKIMVQEFLDEERMRAEDVRRIRERMESGGKLEDALVQTRFGLEQLKTLRDLRQQDLQASKYMQEARRLRLENDERELELGLAKDLTPFQRAMREKQAYILDNLRDFARRDEDGNLVPPSPKEIKRLARQLVRNDGIEPDVGETDVDPAIEEALTGQPTVVEARGLPQQQPTPQEESRALQERALARTRAAAPISTTTTPTTPRGFPTSSTAPTRGIPQQAPRKVGRFEAF